MKQLYIKSLMLYSGRNIYLLMVGLQYLAQCLVGRKCFNNKCMAALAWCSTLLYQRNKNSKPDTWCLLGYLLSLTKMKAKEWSIFESLFPKPSQTINLCLHLAFNTAILSVKISTFTLLQLLFRLSTFK